MRVSLEVYDPNGVKLGDGPVTFIKSASVTQQLDGAGTYSLDLMVDRRVLELVVNDNEIRLRVQQQDGWPEEEWVRGLVREANVDEQEAGTRISVSGPDTLDALTEKTVGIGISYQNASISTIVNSLLAFTPGWTASIDSAIASDLQTDRFDGASIFRCIKRVVEEKGVHFRNGRTANTLEIGAFGSSVTTSSGARVRAIKPPSEITPEMRANPEILFIERISKKKESDNVVNWALPIGAGEGSSALTLRDTTYAIYNANGTLYRAGTASRYPIYRRVNANGIAEYYIDASAGGRQRQLTFALKDIGSVANSDAARQLAANMIANTTMTYLDRQKVILETYRISAKDVKVDIRPGDLLPVDYKGQIEVIDETRPGPPTLTYLDVNQPMWVMKVTKKIADGDISHDYEVATIDRYAMDMNKILVSLMEAIQARNFSVQTFVTPYNYIYKDKVGWNGSNKSAKFYLEFDDEVIDLNKVVASFKTFPLEATTIVADLSPFQYNWALKQSYNYPSDVSLWINGVDVSATFGGPWNVGGTNAALNIPNLNITPYIEGAVGGFRQTHLIEVKCETRLDEVRYDTSFPSVSQSSASAGDVQMAFRVIANSRATLPTS